MPQDILVTVKQYKGCCMSCRYYSNKDTLAPLRKLDHVQPLKSTTRKFKVSPGYQCQKKLKVKVSFNKTFLTVLKNTQL